MRRIVLISGLAAISLALCVLGAFYLPMLALPGLAMAVGSPTVVSGTRSRDSWTQAEAHDASGGPQIGLEDTDYELGIALIEPKQNPLSLISMSSARGTTETPNYHWFTDELMPETDQINYGTGYNTSSTALIVDNGERFAAGDLVMVNTSREVFLVLSVSSDTLTVTRDYGQSTEAFTAASAAHPLDNEYLTIIGNALEPGHPWPSARSTKEVEYHNYCQDMRTPFVVTEQAADTRLRSGESDLAFQERKKAKEHSRKIEDSLLWGKPAQGDKGAYVAATGNTAPGTCGGLNYFLGAFGASNQLIDETELTMDEFIKNLEYVFEWGGEYKICLCPPSLRTGIDQWGISKLQSFSTDEMFGMAVSRWISSHGEILFMTHQMLKNPDSTDYQYAFFIEPSELKWLTFGSNGATRLREGDPYRATGATLIEKEYETIFTFKLGNIPSHSRWRYKTIAA